MTLNKTLEQLPEDIYSLFDPKVKHEINPENLSAFLGGLSGVLRNSLDKRDNIREPLRFSALGRKDRQVWYDAHPDGSKEDFTGKTLFKFLYGHVIEALLLFLAKEAGHTVEREQEEVSVDGVLGHIDAIIDGVVVDVKSASPYGFKKFEDSSILIPGNDSFGYIEQLSGYAAELTPDKASAWIAMDKVSADICVTPLPVSLIKQNLPEPRIQHLKEVLQQPEPPERCYSPIPDGKSGNMKLGVACGYCSHRKRCYPEARTFLYSTGPRFLTRVIREPDVFEAH